MEQSLKQVEEQNRPPAVSVIIPAYRAVETISTALDSVLAQTYTDYEIIVINDGSPDTMEFEGVLSSYDKQINYIKQENKGPSGARNTGIRAARGNYIAFLDADDYWMESYLSEQISILSHDPGLDLIYTD